MKFDKIKLGERIYTARINKGMKQIDIYTKLGLHQSAYSDIENGKRLISIPMLYDIAEILDTTVPCLLGETTDEFTSNEQLEIEKFKDYLKSKRK